MKWNKISSQWNNERIRSKKEAIDMEEAHVTRAGVQEIDPIVAKETTSAERLGPHCDGSAVKWMEEQKEEKRVLYLSPSTSSNLHVIFFILTFDAKGLDAR